MEEITNAKQPVAENLINHPSHYNQYPIEVIDMMIAIWGAEQVSLFCLMNAFKYRMRLGHKDDIQQDIKKEQWYLQKASELKTIPQNPQNPYDHVCKF